MDTVRWSSGSGFRVRRLECRSCDLMLKKRACTHQDMLEDPIPIAESKDLGFLEDFGVWDCCPVHV